MYRVCKGDSPIFPAGKLGLRGRGTVPFSLRENWDSPLVAYFPGCPAAKRIMPEFEFSQTAQHWVNVVLIWVGFGALAGLAARIILPTGRSAGSVATLLLGIAGSMIGLLALVFLPGGRRLNPISPLGFLAATAGAFLLLILYRLLLAYLDKGRKKAHSDDWP